MQVELVGSSGRVKWAECGGMTVISSLMRAYMRLGVSAGGT